MACSSHQSRNVKALRCCQTDGLAGTGYSFKTTEITPVSTTYVHERSNFSSAPGPRTCPDRSSLCATWRVQRSLSTA